MEICWKAASFAIRILIMGQTGYIFSCFAKPFLRKSRYTYFAGAAYFIIMLVLYLIPFEIDSMVAYAAGILAVFAVMYLLDRRNIEQKVFLAVTMYLLIWISHDIAIIPRNILLEISVNSPAMQKREILQFVLYVIIEILFAVLLFVFMALFIHMIKEVYVCKKENMSKKELVLMLSTPLLAIAGYYAFIFFSNAYQNDMGEYVWIVHREYMWLQALYQIISFAVIMITIVVYQGIKESYRKEKENAVWLEQMENMKRHINEAEALYQDIRGLKHDMGNHIMTLKGLFFRNEQEQTIKYLTRLNKQLNDILPEIKSGNPITDVILTEKQKEAKEKGIAFVCDFHYPEETRIDTFDVSVILNNAINNAIEGAYGCNNSYIEIKSYRRSNAYMIEIINSFTGEVIIDEESGIPKTTKNKGKEHGFGIANIRKVAQKYFGDIAIEQNGTDFIFSVMLMVE